MNPFLRFYASIAFALTLLGVFWLPKDVQDWQDAAGPWRDLFSAVDRVTALWVFSAFALLYIFWIDLRPIVKNRLGLDTQQRKFYPPKRHVFRKTARLFRPVTFDFDRVLYINAPPHLFSVFGVFFGGRNNGSRKLKIRATLRVEATQKPLQMHFFVNGEPCPIEDSFFVIPPFKEFSCHTSLNRNPTAELVCDNTISDTVFLFEYAPFSINIDFNGQSVSKRFSYKRLKHEIDLEKDRVLFLEPGKKE
ncbi:MAG: hypothetical protein ACK40W_08280 [Allorhizobium sp.]